MQKFGLLEKWEHLKKGSKVALPRSSMKITVSTPPNTIWVWGNKQGHERFLAVTTGLETLELIPPKGAYIKPDNEVIYKSAHLSSFVVEHSGDETFAEPYEPAERDPRLERIAQMAAENAVRREREMQAEKERQLERQRQLQKAQENAAAPQPTGGNDPAEHAPAPNGNTDAPTPGAGGDNPADPNEADIGAPTVGVSDNGEPGGDEQPNGA